MKLFESPLNAALQSGVEGHLALHFSVSRKPNRVSTTVFKSCPAVNDQLSEACI